ncbi:PAS domain-containing protein tyrosine kinase family protein [Tanacetum coccineum]
MVMMVPHEAFACRCERGDVILRQAYTTENYGKLYYACPKSKPPKHFGCGFFLWKEDRLRDLMSSPGAPSAGPSTPSRYSSVPSTPPSYSSGPSTPQIYSPGSSRNAECSNCKQLRGRISVLKATMEMHMHPEQHTLNSAALLHEVLNEMEKLDLEYSSGSTNNYGQKFDIGIDNFDVEISWNDLILREQIGQGSCGTVYNALWLGSDVAVKVSLMKRLRHPNILLFMGAVTSPEHLCIVTDGSLFWLLHQNTSKLDWRCSVDMAIDIAQGMNYLHHCHPPIVHRDLKSSNLLVDKNWTVKVGDFGLSRIKRETYLTTRNGNGTPQWMAPEILRNEQADEKSDVYSYGVVLWEIATRKISWDDLNPMQVIGAVGFMNRRLQIPNYVNPQWASLIESCWSRFIS